MKTVNSVNAIDHLNGEDEGEDTDHVGEKGMRGLAQGPQRERH